MIISEKKGGQYKFSGYIALHGEGIHFHLKTTQKNPLNHTQKTTMPKNYCLIYRLYSSQMHSARSVKTGF